MIAMMKRDFAVRVAFASGTTNEIERATALAFAREGSSVIVTDGQGRAALTRSHRPSRVSFRGTHTRKPT